MRAHFIARDPRSALARALTLLVLIVVASLMASGCERRSEQAPPAAGAPHATMVITVDYGAETLQQQAVEPNQSVMRALRTVTPVKLAYGGGFVAGMLGHESDAGAQRDWFLFLNGLLTPVGARQVSLKPGDVAWWDYRSWGNLTSPWAAIGSWPAPFTRPADRVDADPPLAHALVAAGATLTDNPASPWRVRVGENDQLMARDPAWRRAMNDPQRAGLTAWIADDTIVALRGDGTPEAVPGARALIAAVPTDTYPADGVLLAVAGLDRAAAEKAADTLATHPEAVSNRYAAVFDGDGRVVAAGGQPTR